MIPSSLLAEIDTLVREGRFQDRESAIREALRRGLDSLRRDGSGGPRTPPRPPTPPGHREPADDRPISVDPTDVNWAP